MWPIAGQSIQREMPVRESRVGKISEKEGRMKLERERESMCASISDKTT